MLYKAETGHLLEMRILEWQLIDRSGDDRDTLLLTMVIQNQRRIVYPHASNSMLLKVLQQISSPATHVEKTRKPSPLEKVLVNPQVGIMSILPAFNPLKQLLSPTIFRGFASKLRCRRSPIWSKSTQ